MPDRLINWLSCFKVVFKGLGMLLALCCFALLAQFATAQSSVTLTTEEQSAIEAHGPWPAPIPDDPGNELSDNAAALTLGKALFSDQALSGDGTVSCASCHVAELGFSDGLAAGVGAETGVRNTQGLFDIGLQHWFGWDGGGDSLWAASIRPMLSEHEMNATLPLLGENLRANSEFVQGMAVIRNTDEQSIRLLDDETLAVLAAKSIAAFIRTIKSGITPFDEYRQAVLNADNDAMRSYPEAAKRGLKIFVGEANCRVCHFGPNFSNGEFHDTGRPFFTGVGQVDPGRYTGIKRVRADRYNLLGEYAVKVSDNAKLKTETVTLGQVNWGQWRTPSLRNLVQTAPYMHDGSLKTLRDVVDAYADIDPDRLHADGEAILKPLPLSEQQREDLVEFLKSLSTTQ